MAVEYDIQPRALVDFIKATLFPSLSSLFEGFPWDFSKMAFRETASWQDVMNVDRDTPYFHGRFLKAKPGAKSDSALVFPLPKTPVEFSLIVDHEQWMEAEGYQENKASNTGPMSVINRSMRSVRLLALLPSCIHVSVAKVQFSPVL